MRILSWNVNGLRSCAQKGFFEFVEEKSLDVICLQETKAHPDQLDPAISSPLGWQTYWSSAFKKGYSGTAMYTKETPTEVQYGINIPRYDEEGRFVISRVRDIWIYNIYFPNGGSGPERHRFKQEFLGDLLHHLKRKVEAGEPVVVAGDYNIAHREIDVYDPKALSESSGFLPEERRWMDEFLSLGFQDSFRKHHPDLVKYSWWSYKDGARIRNKGWRIDYICVSQNLAGKVGRAEIFDGQMGSDHAPVLLELQLT